MRALCSGPGTGYQHFPGCRHGTEQGTQPRGHGLSHEVGQTRREGRDSPGQGGEPHFALQHLPDSCGALAQAETRWQRVPQAGGGSAGLVSLGTPLVTLLPASHPGKEKKKIQHRNLCFGISWLFLKRRISCQQSWALYKREIKQEANKAGQDDY